MPPATASVTSRPTLSPAAVRQAARSSKVTRTKATGTARKTTTRRKATTTHEAATRSAPTARVTPKPSPKVTRTTAPPSTSGRHRTGSAAKIVSITSQSCTKSSTGTYPYTLSGTIHFTDGTLALRIHSTGPRIDEFNDGKRTYWVPTAYAFWQGIGTC
jgi:hypothetical protein